MAWRQITVRLFRAHPLACTPVCIRAHTRVQNGLHIRVQAENAHPSKNEKSLKFPYYKGLSGICTLMRTSHDRSCCGEHIVHIDEVTGSLLFRSYYSILNSSSLLNFQQSEGFYERIFACYPIRSAIFGHF